MRLMVFDGIPVKFKGKHKLSAHQSCGQAISWEALQYPCSAYVHTYNVMLHVCSATWWARSLTPYKLLWVRYTPRVPASYKTGLSLRFFSVVAVGIYYKLLSLPLQQLFNSGWRNVQFEPLHNVWQISSNKVHGIWVQALSSPLQMF